MAPGNGVTSITRLGRASVAEHEPKGEKPRPDDNDDQSVSSAEADNKEQGAEGAETRARRS